MMSLVKTTRRQTWDNPNFEQARKIKPWELRVAADEAGAPCIQNLDLRTEVPEHEPGLYLSLEFGVAEFDREKKEAYAAVSRVST